MFINVAFLFFLLIIR